MGFSLKGFAGGLADAGTSYIEGQQSDRKDAKAATRSLMFNATENMYNSARDIKQKNQDQEALDKKYISGVMSIDPDISQDNKNKLLSLTTEKREQAEAEFYYRQIENPDVTFGDFMTLVDEPEDLDNPESLDTKMAQSYIQKPKLASAYYDKSGLIPDYMIDDIYSEVSGVMTEVYGYSPQQAREITDAGIYQIEHPPIKIEWSKKLFLSTQEITLAAQQLMVNKQNIEEGKIDITTKQVNQTKLAEDAVRNRWLETYQVPIMKDGKPVLLDNGQPKMRLLAKDMVGMTPGVDKDFRNSSAYMKHVKESSQAKIVLMQQDPTNFKEGTMAYLNTAFPGMYGGTIDAADIEGSQYEDYVSTINPNQVFYVNKEIIDTSGREDTKTKGYVLTGAEIIAVWKDKYSKAENMNAANSYIGKTGGGDDSKTDADPIKDANADRIKAINARITRAQQLLQTAKDTNEPTEVIENLSKQVDTIKIDAKELVQEIKEDEQMEAIDANFKEQRKKYKNAPKVFKGDQYSANGNQEDLELAIEQRDKSKIQKVINNINKLIEENPDTVKIQQMLSVGIPLPGNKNYNLLNTKSEAMSALDNMEELLEQDIVEGKNDIKSVQFDELKSKFDSAMESDPTRDELVDLIAEFNDAIELGKETSGSRSQMRVQMLENMKLSLLRGIR